ncbi:glutamate racemase [Candidatus Wolfebacteria bacterium]|nr:glutamate racemase [Candidatus Wolfebacteria bacterium]
MLGFFDSGLGGLTVLKEVSKLLPQYSYVYLGDNARTPYGNRDPETIYRFTCEGIKFLFSKGAKLIILACNTSSATALRKIQQKFLPLYFPDKKVLGIIIPTAEEIEKFSQTKKIGILATKATVNSKSYPKEIKKYSPKIKIYQQPCPLLVPAIETGQKDLTPIIKTYLAKLFVKNQKIDTIILGCTHYAVIEKEIKKILPKNVKIVSQGKIIANKIKDYLFRHPEIEKKLSKKKKRIFFSTKNSRKLEELASSFYNEILKIKTAKI